MYKRAIEYLANILNIFRATDLTGWTEIQFFSSNQRASKLSSNSLRKHAPFSFPSIESYWKNLSNRVLRTGKIHQLYRFNLSLSLKKKRLSSLFRTLVLRRDTDQFLFCLERTNSPSLKGERKKSHRCSLSSYSQQQYSRYTGNEQPSDLPPPPKKTRRLNPSHVVRKWVLVASASRAITLGCIFLHGWNPNSLPRNV